MDESLYQFYLPMHLGRNFIPCNKLSLFLFSPPSLSPSLPLPFLILSLFFCLILLISIANQYLFYSCPRESPGAWFLSDITWLGNRFTGKHCLARAK